MKQNSSFGWSGQELPKAVVAKGTLTTRERAERLYRMGELAAAADLLIKETIQ